MLGEELWERIDEACDSDRAERAQRCSALLAELEATHLPSAEPSLLYALGYLAYCNPGRVGTPGARERTDALLAEAIALDPTHAYAWMYRGYNAYDCKDYLTARAHFAAADPEKLASNFAVSRVELLLCCDIRNAGFHTAIGSLEAYVQLLEASEPPDIFPLSLGQVLEELRPQFLALPAEEREAIRTLLRRADAVDVPNWLSKHVAE